MSKTEWMDTFSSNLIYWLHETQMTQMDLAIRSGLSQSSISNYINKQQTPGISAIISIANAFGIAIDELVYIAAMAE